MAEEPDALLIERCPCGYVTECGIWCGGGHESGLCPALAKTAAEQAVIDAAREWAVDRVAWDGAAVTLLETVRALDGVE